MNAVTSWLLSVVGIVVIGVLIDIILPEGEIQKYIKAVFSIFIVFVMISPVVDIDISKINFDKFVYNDSSVVVDENYLKNYNNSYKESLQKVCETNLKANGFDGVDVEIVINLSTTKFDIEKVYLNLTNLVMNSNSVHIDKYEEIKSIVISILGVDEDMVVIYE